MSAIFNTNNSDGDYNVTKFAVNQVVEAKLDKNTIWVQDILKELNENADEKDENQYLNDTSLNIDLEIQKKFKNDLGEYFIVTGEITTRYQTKCVKTLKDMPMDLNIDIKAAFVDLSLEANDQFKDQTETFLENDVYELYFYAERKISLKEVVNELIYLNIDQYPSLEKNFDENESISPIKQ